MRHEHLLIPSKHFFVPVSSCSSFLVNQIGLTKTSQSRGEGLFPKGKEGSTKRQWDNSWVAKRNRCSPPETRESLALHSRVCSTLLITRFYYEDNGGKVKGIKDRREPSYCWQLSDNRP